MSTTTIDGYELGSGLIVNYHTADSNKDGNISLFELTRVIELKNASGGYRVQAGTEDGFAPVYETTTVDLTPSIKIISPNGGEKFTGGQTVDIHWISLNIPVGRPVSIELYRKSVNPDGSITRRGIGLVADQIANTGVYSWTIPTYFSEASNYSIMINGSVTGEEGSGFADNSDSTFSISGGKPIVIEFSSPTVSEGDTLRVYADTTKSQYPNSEFAIFALESLDGTAYIASNYTYKKDNFGRWYQDFAISSTTKQGTWVVRLVGTFANNAVQQYFNYGFDIDASFEVVPRNIVTVTCTDSDGGTNLDVAGLTDGRVNGSGSYFTDISVSTNGSMCSGDGCTSVAEGVCLNGAVTNQLHLCPSGYSVGGVCSAKHQVSTTTPVVIFENNTGGNVIITNIDTVQIPETVEQTEIIEIYQVVPEVDIIQVSEPVLEVTQEPETVYLPEMVIQESISEPQQSIETPVESNTMAPEMAEAQE